MSDSNQHIVYIGAETEFGQVRTDTQDLTRINVTGFTLKKTRSSHPSAALREDRNVADFRLGATDVSGDVSIELGAIISGDLGSLLTSLMRSPYTEISPITRTDISAASGDNSLNTVAGTMPLVEEGDTIYISGFTGTVGNNGYATVVSRTSAKIVISGKTLVADSAGESVTIAPQTYIYNPGTDPGNSVAFDVKHNQVTLVDNYHYFSGCHVNSMNVKVPADGLCSATFSMMGQDMQTYDDAISGASYDAAAYWRPTDGYTGSVTIDGTSNATVTELDFTISNNLATRHVIGSQLTQDFTLGQVNITGNMTAFFGSDATDLMGKFLNEEPVALRKRIIDTDGYRVEFRFPRIFYTGASADTNGVSGEITTPLPFQAVYDATAGHAFQIRFNRKPTA